jgi:hypothetical protein
MEAEDQELVVAERALKRLASAPTDRDESVPGES